ncbi:MAG: FHA domain-containing protein [Chloroflexota bacterium]
MTDSKAIPCPTCGTLNPPGTKYCSKCRNQLIAVSTLSVGRKEIDERDPTLRIVPDEGQPFTVLLLEKVLDVGSEPHQAIAIQSPGVALRHARLTLEGSSYRLYNITSGNGVLVNGKPIDSALLKDGDSIRLQDPTGHGVNITYSNPVERGGSTQSIGKLYAFDTFPFVLGRDPQANIKLEALAISWHHAEITELAGKHVLTDLGSTNGTFVNDKRLTAPYRLQDDDLIRIDRVLMVYKGRGLVRLDSTQRFQLDAIDIEMTYHSGFPRRANNTMRDVTLAIEPQEFIAVIGGSGSGKSTLLRALNGANRASGGQVLVNGDNLYTHYPMYQPIIGYVPQTDIVQNDLTVYQALMYGARLRFPNEPMASRDQRITRVLETLELTDFRTQLVRSLSGGQKKRVSIALELMAEPGLLFMDEPSSGLDPGLDKSMMDTLRRLADRGHVVIVVTHTTLNIEQCDQLAFMARGNLVYFGPPKESLSFFGVRDYPEIYNRVFEPIDDDTPQQLSPGEAAKQWAEHFRQSPQYDKNVVKRLKESNESEAESATAMLSNRHLHGSRRGSFWHQARVLTERTLTLALHDSRTLIALLLVLPLVGLFLAALNFDNVAKTPGQMLVSRGTGIDFADALDQIPLTPIIRSTNAGSTSSNVKAMASFAPAADAQRLLFMMALSVTLLGLFASAYTIVEEKSLFLRERMVNLRIGPYLASKVAVYWGLALISCLLMLVTIALGVQIPGQGLLLWGPLELFISLALTALAGVSIGLLLSSLVPQVNAVTYAVLAVLFVQILFPGVLFKMDGALEPLSKLTITRWSLEALGGTANMPSREAEAKIIVLSPVVDKNNKPIPALGDSKQFLPAPPSLSLTYPHNGGDLLARWGVLLGFSLLFLLGAGMALNRNESF